MKVLYSMAATRSSFEVATRSSFEAATRSSFEVATKFIKATSVAAAFIVAKVRYVTTDFMIMISAASDAVTRRTDINTDFMIMISAASDAVTRRYCGMLLWDIHCRMHCS